MKKLSKVLVVSALLFGTVGIVGAQEAPPPGTQPDNTAVNVRDRNPDSMTAGEQATDKGDTALTQQIRKAVVADDSLSMLAKNVKIVSANGVVVLRGPVNTEQEKSAVAAKAEAVAGADKVHNELEVKSAQ